MDGVDVPYNPRTVEEVFRDFKGRRAALIKALTIGQPFSFFITHKKSYNFSLYFFFVQKN
jgi:hypothetical protein